MEPTLLRIGNWSLSVFKNKNVWSKGLPKLVPWIIGKLIHTIFFKSQVLTLEELKILLNRLEESDPNFIATIGVCPCRKGMDQWSDTIPAFTDIQIYLHGEIYIQYHPEYKKISVKELIKKLEHFDKLGLVHTLSIYVDKLGQRIQLSPLRCVDSGNAQIILFYYDMPSSA